MSAFPGWKLALLTAIAAPPTPGNLELLNAWHDAEGGAAANNPLNTTEAASGATNYNSVGVKNYPTPASGIAATRRTLLNGHYNGIVLDLRAGKFRAIDIYRRNAGEFATWGTGAVLASVLGAAGGGSASSSSAARTRPGGQDDGSGGFVDALRGLFSGAAGAGASALGISDVLGLVSGPVDFFRFLIALLDPRNWLRALEVLVGMGLIFSGLVGFVVVFGQKDDSPAPIQKASKGTRLIVRKAAKIGGAGA